MMDLNISCCILGLSKVKCMSSTFSFISRNYIGFFKRFQIVRKILANQNVF